jgi:O-antigen chain-terminating methyltransferase
MSAADAYRHLAALGENAAVDELPQPAGRSKGIKRFVLRLTGFFLVRQRAANFATKGAIEALLLGVDELNARLDDERRRTAASIAAIEPRLIAAAQLHRVQLDRLEDRVAELQRMHGELEAALQSGGHDLASLSGELRTLARSVDDLNADAMLERTRRRALERRVALSTPPDAAGEARVDLADDVVAPPSFDLAELYERFEASFRPSDEHLIDRFATYVHDLEPLRGGTRPVLDVGTGRGELLEVLAAAGIPCKGIDLNPEAVTIARSKGLDVELADLMGFLTAQPDESLGAVVALHVVEHLPPEVLLSFVDEAMRTLAPGGLVIFETPNPTNLVVGASSFYHDPTHERPVTPDYLAFLLHDRGFADVEVRFLHPLPEFALDVPSFGDAGMRGLELLLTDLRWALKGPQDYAAIGRRPAGRSTGGEPAGD